MQIIYEGPRASVMVDGFGEHKKDETKSYPQKAGQKLLETSVTQQFREVKPKGRPAGKTDPDPDKTDPDGKKDGE